MRILLLDWTLPELLKDSNSIAGGASAEWYSWIKGITESNHEFVLLTYKGANEYIGRKLNFEIIESYNENSGIRKIGWIFNKFPSLYNAINKSKPDVIIVMGASNFVGVLAIIGRLLKIPFVFRLANDPNVDERQRSLMSFSHYQFYKFGLKLTKNILAQNSYQYQKIKEKYPEKKVIILPVPFANEDKSNILSTKEREYIAWVANFRYQKNLSALYQVATKLKNFKFKIAGLPQPNIDLETAQAIDNLKGLNNVEFLGYIPRSQMSEFYSKAILLLNTSRWEGFSNAFLEAWAAGVPVVTTKKVNPDNLITQYDLGLVADDYEDLPQKIIQLVNSPDYNNYVMRTYNYVKDNHDPRHLTKKLVDFLTENGKVNK